MKPIAVVALYVLLAGTVSFGEAVGAAIVLAAAIAYMLALRRTAEREIVLSGRGAWALAKGAGRVLPESVTVLRALSSAPASAVGVVPFDADGAAGRRAATVLGLSLAPNGFVTGFDEQGDILLHQLARGPIGGNREWPL